MISIRVLVAVLVCALVTPGEGWRRRRRTPCPAHTSALPGAINSWDNAFTFQCPPGESISVVKSVHCNTAEDRVWSFQCKTIPGLTAFSTNYWSAWVNGYDGDMTYRCPGNMVVTGFQSEHSNDHEDRRWKLKCSTRSGMTTSGHHLDLTANTFDGNMNYYVPSGFYIDGMHGYHHNDPEDRIYQFDLCAVNL